MIHPDEETLRAIISIEGNPNWDAITKWIDDSLWQIHRELGSNSVFNAGRIAELLDIQNKIASARGTLRNITG